MKIIFLVESKFCKKDYDRFGLDILSNRGYGDIEVWDFSRCFRPDYFKMYTPADILTGANYISIPNKNFAIQLLQELQINSVFVCAIWPSARNLYIFNYLNKSQKSYGFMSFGHTPSGHDSILARFIMLTTKPLFVLKRLVDLSSIKISSLLGSPISPDFVILGGVSTSKLADKKTILLKTHTLDYDLFLSSRGVSGLERNQKYAVFIDQYLPYHPDTINSRITNATHYYSTLNDFFEYVEFKMGMEVIIAPHPRANYASIGNPFDGRSIIDEPTHKIVKNSELVIAHNSSSIAFAVLYSKPILFLNDDTYHPRMRNFINSMANHFQKTPVNISKSDFAIKADDIVVDKDIYDTYKDLYIKEKGTLEKQTWDIFADYLDQTLSQ